MGNSLTVEARDGSNEYPGKLLIFNITHICRGLGISNCFSIAVAKLSEVGFTPTADTIVVCDDATVVLADGKGLCSGT